MAFSRYRSFFHSHSYILFQFPNYSNEEEQKTIHYSLCRNDSFYFDSGVSFFLPYSYFDKTFLRIFAVCHGLLCISYFDYSRGVDDCSSLIICNPSIRRFLSLPKPQPFPVHQRRYSTATVAIGFDSRNRHYKIVRIVSFYGNDIHHRGLTVQVYSLASGLWRTVPGHVAPACTLSRAFNHEARGFVNGLVHWCASRIDTGQFFVLSFDFVDEVFDEIALPDSLARASSRSWVSVIGGGNEKEALFVYHVNPDDWPCFCSIWMMKEYGDSESWNKVFQFYLTGSSFEAPSFGMTINGVVLPPAALCVANNGEILLLQLELQGEECLYLVDVEKKGFVDLYLEAQSPWWRNSYIGYYAESLVLLDNAGALNSY